jgi:hypothetical protein
MKWKWYYGLIIFVLLYLIQVYFDENMYVCTDFKSQASILLHHLTSIYGIFGSILFGYYKIHLLFCIMVILEITFLDKCVITEYTKSVCKKYTKNHKDYVQYVFERLNLSDKGNFIIFANVCLSIYDGYMISKGYQ